DSRVRLPAGTARIGTAVGCKLRLSDPTVSRFHCETTLTEDGFRVIDSGSRNGTFIDGVRVYDAALLAGATLRIGSTAVRVEFGGLPVHVPLSPHDRFGAEGATQVSARFRGSVQTSAVPGCFRLALCDGERGAAQDRALQYGGPRLGERAGTSI